MAKRPTRPTPFHQPPGAPIAYYPSLVPVAGSVKAAVLLCQLIYWTPRTRNSDGWIYKSRLQLMAETGMTGRELDAARAEVKRRGLLLDRYGREDHRLYLRVDVQKYNDAIALISDTESDEAFHKKGNAISQKGKCHSTKSEMAFDKTANRSSTESTSEITSEITSSSSSSPSSPLTPVSEEEGEEEAQTVARAQKPEAKAKAKTNDAAREASTLADQGFEVLYEAYERKDQKEKARRAFDEMHIDAPTLAVILERLPEQWARWQQNGFKVGYTLERYLRDQKWTEALPVVNEAALVWDSEHPEPAAEAGGCKSCAGVPGVYSVRYCDTCVRQRVEAEARVLADTLRIDYPTVAAQRQALIEVVRQDHTDAMAQDLVAHLITLAETAQDLRADAIVETILAVMKEARASEVPA